MKNIYLDLQRQCGITKYTIWCLSHLTTMIHTYLIFDIDQSHSSRPSLICTASLWKVLTNLLFTHSSGWIWENGPLFSHDCILHSCCFIGFFLPYSIRFKERQHFSLVFSREAFLFITYEFSEKYETALSPPLALFWRICLQISTIRYIYFLGSILYFLHLWILNIYLKNIESKYF